jgi:hypothetical protein
MEVEPVSDHLTSSLLEQYRKGSLPSAELLAADDHLAACAHCRELASRADAVKKNFRALAAELHALEPEGAEHLSYERLAALVRREMDEVEREIVESHLAICGECAGDVRDLSAFASRHPGRREPKAERPAPFSLWEKLAAFWLPLRGRPDLRLGFSTVLVLVFLGTFLWWLFAASNPRPWNEAARNQTRSPDAAPSAQPERPQPPAPSPPEASGLEASRPAAVPPPLRPVESEASRPGGSTPLAGPSPAPEIVAALDDGQGRVTLDRHGRIKGLPSLPPDLRQAVGTALQTRQVPTPAAIRELAGVAGTLLGGAEQGGAFAVSAPAGTVVRSTRPTLAWQPLGGASSYKVTVFDADFNVVADSPPLTATSWMVPQPLRRGVVYSWQVTARKDGAEVVAPSPAAPEVRFKVLDENSLKKLSPAERACHQSQLACGVLYSRVGLLDEAEREFKSLADANPRSTLARALLRDVRKARRPR